MAVTLADVLTLTRTYLNDDNSNQWPDPSLIPKTKIAHQELQSELWVNGSPIVRGQSPIITVNPSGSVIDLTQLNPAGFPQDMLLPTSLYESTVGTNVWLPVTEQIYFPMGYAPISKINMWSFQQEHLLLAPSNQSNILVIQFRRALPIPNVNTDPIGILFGEMYLGARTAAIAASSVGNAAVANEMRQLAKENFAKLLLANRGQQKAMFSPGMGYSGITSTQAS